MADAISDFFRALKQRDGEPLLRKTSGTLRFDLAEDNGTQHWYLSVDKGDISVSRRKGAADAVVQCERATFEGMIKGDVNAMAAVLRGAILVEGNLGLVLSVGRLFRGTHEARAGALRPATRGGCHERPRPDSRGKHLRRQ
jgi:putative sterol carrier protein